MVFSGNPGNGKTMIARLMSRIYLAWASEQGHLVEVRSGLVAATGRRPSKQVQRRWVACCLLIMPTPSPPAVRRIMGRRR